MRKLLVLLCLVVLCGMLLPESANAATNLSNSTTFSINGKTIKAADVEWQGKSGCWYYAQKIYGKIWGSTSTYSNKFSSSNNILKNLSNEERKVTAENTSYFIGKSKLGAVIRVCGCSSDCKQWTNDGLTCGHEGHSMILVAKNSASLTVVHNNSSGVKTTKYTWEEFYKSYGARDYTYFKYIKWPNASPISAYQKDYDVIDSKTRIAVSTKTKTGNADDDQCYIKDTPFEAGKTVDVIAKGSVIHVVGAVKNKHGNTWYKTKDGNYVWSGDVTVWEYSDLFSLSANFKNRKDQNSHAAPYADSDKIKAYPAGKSFKVKAFVTNSHGNIWAELADGGYMNFYDKGADLLNMDFVSHVTQPTHDTSYPTGDIKVTSSFGFRLEGKVKAQVPFLTLTTRIVDRKTEKDVTAAGSPMSVKPGASIQTIDLYTTKIDGKTVDSQTMFRKLTGSSAWYRYELNAQFGFTYAGKTFKFGSEMNLVSSNFSVGNPSTNEPPSDEQVIPVSCPSHLTISVGETYWFTSTATGEVSWEFTRGGELLIIEEEDGEYSLRPIKEGIAIVEYTGADGSKAKMGITIMPYTMYCEIYPEPSDDWNVVVTAGVNQSYKLYLLGPQDKYVSKPVWSVSDPSIANIVSVDDRICTVQATGNGTVMLRASVDILMEDGYLNPTETWTAELKLSVKKPSNGESDNTPTNMSNIAMSAPTDLKAEAGETVVVPISINNPDNVELGSITLYYTLPDGVKLSNVTACGPAANASVTADKTMTFASDINAGISGSGKVLVFTLVVDENATFPLNFSMQPEVVAADLSADATPAAITVTIEERVKRTPGDVNEDGKVNSRDALAVLKYAAGQNVTINTATADVNADGKINSRDALSILKYAAGQDVTLK